MTLTVSAQLGPNDMMAAPQARLTGGPFSGSVIELKDKASQQITIQEDETTAAYHNTGQTNSENQHVFLYSDPS